MRRLLMRRLVMWQGRAREAATAKVREELAQSLSRATQKNGAASAAAKTAAMLTEHVKTPPVEAPARVMSCESRIQS